MRLEIRNEGGPPCHGCGSLELIKTVDTYEELAHDLFEYIAAEVFQAEIELTALYAEDKSKMYEMLAKEKEELRARMLANREGMEDAILALASEKVPRYRIIKRRRQERWRHDLARVIDEYRAKTFRV